MSELAGHLNGCSGFDKFVCLIVFPAAHCAERIKMQTSSFSLHCWSFKRVLLSLYFPVCHLIVCLPNVLAKWSVRNLFGFPLLKKKLFACYHCWREICPWPLQRSYVYVCSTSIMLLYLALSSSVLTLHWFSSIFIGPDLLTLVQIDWHWSRFIELLTMPFKLLNSNHTDFAGWYLIRVGLNEM